MTQGPGPHYGGDPAGGFAPPNPPWGQEDRTQLAHQFDPYQQQQQQPPAWAPGPQPFTHPGMPPQPRNRKPLIIGLSVGGALLLVIIVVVSIVAFSGGDEKSTAGAAVKGYLEALAKGDAAKALSFSNDKPANTEFLTNDILKKQIAKWPITDIKILSDDGSYGFGRVHVSAKFGDKVSDEEITVKKSGKEWMIEHAAIKMDPKNAILNNEAMKTLTVFGKPIGDTPVYVFPGWVEMGSENPNLSADPKKPFLLKELYMGDAYLSDVEFSLSSKGEKAVSKAISNKLAQCTASTSLRPPDCPQRVYKYELVDGTASWGTADSSKLKVEVRAYTLEASITGEVVFPLTARTRDGDTWTGTDTESVYGKADLSQDPPTVNLN